MSKFCSNCGKEMNSEAVFCPNCGGRVEVNTINNNVNNNPSNNINPNNNVNYNPSNNINPNNNVNYNPGNNQSSNPTTINNYYTNNNYSNAPVIAKRDIAVAVILSIITCGIYGIYWYIVVTNDANKVSDRPTDTSGGVAFLLSLITCGIYGIYWNYKMGKKLYEAGQKYNKPISDNSVIYLILPFIGLQILSIALIQSDLNKFAN